MSDTATLVAGLAIAVIAYLLGHIFGCRRAQVEDRIRQIVDEATLVLALNRELLANAWVQVMLDRGKGGGTSESAGLKTERAEAQRMIRELLNTVDVARMMTAAPPGAGSRAAAVASVQSLMAAIAGGWERSFGTGPHDQVEPGPRFAATQSRRVQQLETEVGRLLDPPDAGDRLRETIYRAVATISGGLRSRLTGTRLDPLMEPEAAEEVSVA